MEDARSEVSPPHADSWSPCPACYRPEMTVLREFQPGLWLTELELEDFDVRGAVLVGSRRVVVWETLSHPRDMAGVPELAAGRPLSVVYSHADWDHSWGTAALRADEVVGHAMCLERFSDDVPATLGRKLVERPEHWRDVRLIPPNRTFQSDLTIDLGDLTLVLHHLPGHTPDCCVGFVPERGLLLMGDCVETPLPVVNANSPLEAWIAGLAGWTVDERVQTVIPAHGPIGGRELIKRNIAYLSALLSGKSPEVPAAMTDFYCNTHERNQRHAR